MVADAGARHRSVRYPAAVALEMVDLLAGRRHSHRRRRHCGSHSLYRLLRCRGGLSRSCTITRRRAIVAMIWLCKRLVITTWDHQPSSSETRWRWCQEDDEEDRHCQLWRSHCRLVCGSQQRARDANGGLCCVCVRALRRGCEQPGHIYRSKWSSASSIRGDKMAASKCFLTFFPGFSDTIDWRSQHSGSMSRGTLVELFSTEVGSEHWFFVKKRLWTLKVSENLIRAS